MNKEKKSVLRERLKLAANSTAAEKIMKKAFEGFPPELNSGNFRTGFAG